jgi:hypothetical protein
LSRLTLPVPSLIGGVSTQPEATRLPQQAELSDNCLGSIIEGLRRRPPAEHQHVFPLLAGGTQHEISLVEGQFLLHTDGATELRVYDVEDGTSQQVLNSLGQPIQGSDLGYLNCPNPRQDLRFLTLADYTLILNRGATVATRGTTPPRAREALIRITQGAYRARYIVRIRLAGLVIREVFVETYSSGGEPPLIGVTQNINLAETSVRTDVIAKELRAMLWDGVQGTGLHTSWSGATAGAPMNNGLWTIETSGSTIRIQHNLGDDFDVAIDESIGQTSMVVINKSVQLFSELPSSAPANMVVEVIGDPDETESSYWAKFVTHDATYNSTEFGEGYWEETVAPSLEAGMDWDTLPQALLRQANGQWRLLPLAGQNYTVVSGTNTIEKAPEWELRSVGDDKTNPHPDFVGGKIQGMCFHEGRLGLISETSITLSEVREPFNLYRTTVIDVLDSERIVVKAPTKKAERLHHCIPLSGDIVLFSEETQYLLRSSGPLTPSSVSLIAAGNHDADPTAEPIPVGTMLFVPRAVGVYGAVSALQTLGDERPSLESADLTANVPGFLSLPHRIITTPQLDLVATYSEDSSDLYVYSEFYNGGEKVHQSWQRWTFGHNILHAWFHETTLFILAQVGTEEHLWKLRMEPEAKDGVRDLTFLDQRVRSQDLAAGVVVASTVRPGYSTTTYVLPYEDLDLECRVQETGKAVRVLSIGESGVVVEGNTADDNLWFGVPFESRHDLSRIIPSDSQRAPISQGILRLDQGIVFYDESGAFDVVIMDNFGGEHTHRFAGPYLGQGANYQNLRLTSGRLIFPIRARSEDVRISFRTSGTEGMRLVSLDITARRSRTGKRQRTQ